MATIYIHDTGLLTTSSTTALTGASNVANNGTEIPLKILSLKFNRGINVDDKPIPASYSETELNYVCFENATIELKGQIHRKGDLSSATNVTYKIHGGDASITDAEGSASSDEVKMLGLLDLASRTKGYKELYYKDATSADNLFFGLATNTEISGTYKCFRVRIINLSITETPDSNLIVWNLSLKTTA